MSRLSRTVSSSAGPHKLGDTITLLCAYHDPASCHRGLLATLVLGTLDDDA